MDIRSLVKELREYLSILNVKQISDLDGDAISRLAVKLASYASTLGEYVAEAERNYQKAEMNVELVREQLYKAAREDKKTIADADSIKKLGSRTEAQEALDLKYNWRVLQMLRADTHSLIDALRSRLSYLKQDREIL